MFAGLAPLASAAAGWGMRWGIPAAMAISGGVNDKENPIRGAISGGLMGGTSNLVGLGGKFMSKVPALGWAGKGLEKIANNPMGNIAIDFTLGSALGELPYKLTEKPLAPMGLAPTRDSIPLNPYMQFMRGIE